MDTVALNYIYSQQGYDSKDISSAAEPLKDMSIYHKVPWSESMPSITMPIVILDISQGDSYFTSMFNEDNKWFLSADEEEWDHFMITQMSDDSI